MNSDQLKQPSQFHRNPAVHADLSLVSPDPRLSPPRPPDRREICVENVTSTRPPQRTVRRGAPLAIDPNSPHPPRPEKREIWVENETFADTRDRKPNDALRLKRSHVASATGPRHRHSVPIPPQASILRVESETFADMSDRNLIAVPATPSDHAPPTLMPYCRVSIPSTGPPSPHRRRLATNERMARRQDLHAGHPSSQA